MLSHSRSLKVIRNDTVEQGVCKSIFNETVWGQRSIQVSTLTRDIDIAIMSVRPSVRLSVTFRYQFFHRTVAQSFQFYQHQTSSRNSDGSPPPAEVINTGGLRWGIKISRFPTNKSLYLANDTRYRHSYYGRRIGNCTQAFEWHHSMILSDL